MCTPFLDYQKINPNTQLTIIAECISGCFEPDITSFSNLFSISQEWVIESRKKWMECVPNTMSTNFFNSKLS